jgi:hypothetical protein
VNYNVDCVGGTIYLMGVAQNKAELQRVIDHARDIPYVRQVVSYVRIKDPAKPASPPPAKPQPAKPAPGSSSPPAPAAGSLTAAHPAAPP